MISLSAIAKPSLAPANERDFEKVPTHKRFLYFLVSSTQDVPPKSTYASSIRTIESWLEFNIFSISFSKISIPVGAFGFAITISLFLWQKPSTYKEKSSFSGITSLSIP